MFIKTCSKNTDEDSKLLSLKEYQHCALPFVNAFRRRFPFSFHKASYDEHKLGLIMDYSFYHKEGGLGIVFARLNFLTVKWPPNVVWHRCFG